MFCLDKQETGYIKNSYEMRQKELKELQYLFGNNFVGPEQINKMLFLFGLPELQEEDIPKMHYSKEILKLVSNDYLLVMGFPGKEKTPLNILKFRDFFGINPEKSEPCFYNQDWYLHEEFVQKSLDSRWYLINKEVLEESRSERPEELLKEDIVFPSAILCVYSFFAYFISYKHLLWKHDFVWCDDIDHNGDRIYVGKYNDIDGINKNGFSIHRHLSLRPCYAAIRLL